MFHFTIRDVLWLTVVVALAVGWWIDDLDVTINASNCLTLTPTSTATPCAMSFSDVQPAGGIVVATTTFARVFFEQEGDDLCVAAFNHESPRLPPGRGAGCAVEVPHAYRPAGDRHW